MNIEVRNLDTAIVCEGIGVRTTNYKETQPEKAKLGELWQQFYQTHAEQLPEDAEVYGIYHNYESDDTGEFDVVAGWHTDSQPDSSENTEVEGADIESTDETVSVTIPAGKYLVFSQQGSMPNMVIEGWDKVWTYFGKPKCEYIRTFAVDFEHYVDTDPENGQVDIYIGIE